MYPFAHKIFRYKYIKFQADFFFTVYRRTVTKKFFLKLWSKISIPETMGLRDSASPSQPSIRPCASSRTRQQMTYLPYCKMRPQATDMGNERAIPWEGWKDSRNKIKAGDDIRKRCCMCIFSVWLLERIDWGECTRRRSESASTFSPVRPCYMDRVATLVLRGGGCIYTLHHSRARCCCRAHRTILHCKTYRESRGSDVGEKNKQYQEESTGVEVTWVSRYAQLG